MSEINWNELKDKAHSNAVKHGFSLPGYFRAYGSCERP